jgi:hypothetical protein
MCAAGLSGHGGMAIDWQPWPRKLVFDADAQAVRLRQE